MTTLTHFRPATLFCLIFLIVAIVFPCNATSAERNPAAMTARDLFQICTSDDPGITGFCHGYIQGVHDSFSDKLCAPPGIARADIASAIVDLMQANPELLELHASAVVYATLISAYPCENSQ